MKKMEEYKKFETEEEVEKLSVIEQMITGQ